MKVINPGHSYEVAHLDSNGKTTITFVNRGHGCDSEGTTCQELLRVLIDRVKFLDNELPWDGNEGILQHLRMALILFECRALLRKVEKHKILPEFLTVNNEDLHIKL